MGSSRSKRIKARFEEWIVTNKGIDCTSRYYFIAKSQLGDPDWIDHMSGKSWVNIEDFIKALALWLRGSIIKYNLGPITSNKLRG